MDSVRDALQLINYSPKIFTPYEYNIRLYNLYIGFRQAVDSIHRGRVLEDIVSLGIPKKLVQLLYSW